MKILVCGGRDYFNAERIDRVLDLLGPTLVIHGDAPGADALAANWAVKRGIKHECHKADWQTHGRAAGPIRNREMLKRRPELVIAFPGGAGTADCVGAAMQAGIPVTEIS